MKNNVNVGNFHFLARRMQATEAETDAKVKTMASSCCPRVPETIFTATQTFKVDQHVLTFVVGGTLWYANRFIKISASIKVEKWIFCIEENVVMSGLANLDPASLNSNVAVGAFRDGAHYTFFMIQKVVNESPNFEPFSFLFEWITAQIFPIFYPNGFRIPERPDSIKEGQETPARTTIKSFPLENPEIVPNDLSVSEFFSKRNDK
jgi:hypothetical protein